MADAPAPASDVSAAVSAAIASAAGDDAASRKRARTDIPAAGGSVALTIPVTKSFPWESKLAELISSGKMMPGDLDDGAITQLKQVPDAVATACLEHFASTDLSSVRSKSAYMVGIIRRLNTSGGAAANPYGPGTASPSANVPTSVDGLPVMVQSRLQQIYASGSVKPDELEPRVLLELMEFGEQGACTILERYASKNLSAVRNKTAFLIGVVKRYREEVKAGGGQSASSGHYGGGGGGGNPNSAALASIQGGGAQGNAAVQSQAQQSIMMHSPMMLHGMGMLTRDQVSIIQSMVAGNMVAAGHTGMDPTAAYAAQQAQASAATGYPQTGYADPNAAYGAQYALQQQQQAGYATASTTGFGYTH